MIRGLALLAALLSAAPAAADPVMRMAVADNGFDLEPSDILQAEAEPTDLGAVVFFRFAPAPSKALADLTAASIGMPLDLIVCGEVVISPVVMEVIATGVGQINLSDLTRARQLAAVLHGDMTCIDYRGT